MDTIWYSDYFVDNALTQNVMNAIKQNGCKAYTPKTGKTYQIGDATVEVIADGRNAKSVSTSKSKEVISNNSSLVVKVTCAGKSALFTGDARSEVEDKLPKSKVKSYFVLKIESVIQHLQKHHVIILIKNANHLKVLKTNIN